MLTNVKAPGIITDAVPERPTDKLNSSTFSRRLTGWCPARTCTLSPWRRFSP
jgi:hypothetical protein